MNALRDTPVGDLLRWTCGKAVLLYPEEKEDFDVRQYHFCPRAENFHTSDAMVPGTHDIEADSNDNARSVLSAKSCGSQEPTKLVDWYGSEDPAHPHNWSSLKKTMVYFQISYYTFAMYMAASLFAPAMPEIMSTFDVPHITASLGLALFVLGYGFGPMIWSPMSEIAAIGHNPIYTTTLVLFLLISVPTALIDNVAGLMVLRFLQGFIGSPPLAVGGATYSNITKPHLLPYGLYIWAFCSFVGPSVGPIIAGYSVPVVGWRWALWEVLLSNGLALPLMLFLPETSHEKILYRRAKRLRQLTGDASYRTATEIRQASIPVSSIINGALVVPWKINALDPSILFTSLYCGMVYAVFYSFFEVFPLVYQDIYGMSEGEMGLIYLSIIIAVCLAAVPHFAFIHFKVNPAVRKGLSMPPEKRLIPGLVASIVIPVGVFLLAWTSRRTIHWVVPTIGVVLAAGGTGIIIQSIFVYIALAYPQYAASLFGGNGLIKSAVACAGVLWSAPLYSHLGVAKGVSLLGGLCIGFSIGMLLLIRYGAELRAKSRFAVKSDVPVAPTVAH